MAALGTEVEIGHLPAAAAAAAAAAVDAIAAAGDTVPGAGRAARLVAHLPPRIRAGCSAKASPSELSELCYESPIAGRTRKLSAATPVHLRRRALPQCVVTLLVRQCRKAPESVRA